MFSFFESETTVGNLEGWLSSLATCLLVAYGLNVKFWRLESGIAVGVHRLMLQGTNSGASGLHALFALLFSEVPLALIRFELGGAATSLSSDTSIKRG